MRGISLKGLPVPETQERKPEQPLTSRVPMRPPGVSYSTAEHFAAGLSEIARQAGHAADAIESMGLAFSAGTAAAFPALRRSRTGLVVRRADDSAPARISDTWSFIATRHGDRFRIGSAQILIERTSEHYVYVNNEGETLVEAQMQSPNGAWIAIPPGQCRILERHEVSDLHSFRRYEATP